jgi:2-dehydropantoate 2-reductase
MKVCVVGAGAIGGVLAAKFAMAGFATCVVARGAHLHAIESRGLTLKSPDAAHTVEVRASDDPGLFGVQDVVFIGLKAHQIGDMLPRIAPLVGKDTIVVPAINGLPWWYFFREGGRFDGSVIEAVDPGGKMLKTLDAHRLVGCVVHMSGEVTDPGIVRWNGQKVFVLGEPDGSLSRRLNGLAEAMRQCGFEPRVTERIRDEVWMKLIGNTTFNPLATLTLATMDKVSANPAMCKMILDMMAEMKQVADAYGIRQLVSFERRMEIARSIGPVKVSMHQDFERGRPMEIAGLVTAVLELAERVNLPTPWLTATHGLILELQRNAARAGGPQ